MTAALHQQWIHFLTATTNGDAFKVATPEADATAFLELLRRHKNLLYQIIRSHCANAGEWQDLEQEIILQLWRSYPRFDRRYRPSTWIYRIAFNVTVSAFRRQRKRQRHEIAAPSERFFQRAADDPADAALAEQRERLYSAIRNLSPANRSVLLLHLDGHDYAAIAEILGISPTNVGTKLSRIRHNLRSVLNP